MTHSLPDWIADEDRLRDEAVLFGVADVRPDEKLAAIRLAFAALMAPLEKRLEQTHEAVIDLNDAIDRATGAVAHLNQRAETDAVPRPAVDWLLGGIGASVGLGVGIIAAVGQWLPGQLMAGWGLAGLLGVSGCVGTLLLALSHYRARLAQHTAQTTARTLDQTRLDRQLQAAQAEKRDLTAMRYATEAELSQLTATRDRRMRLFESEYNLARSVRQPLSQGLYAV